ncbi:hypothetical protein GCM10023078_06180 [Gibbsiella greigii]
MYWNDLEGAIILNKVFSKPVEISEIDVFDIKIDREGPSVIITFDLVNQLPDNPPVKWVKGYNRCRCGINCIGIKSLKIDGVDKNMLSSIFIDKSNSHNEVSIKGSGFNLYLMCSHIQFMGPSVYISQ